jgi:phosphonate transport system substrate-binding protein
MGSKLLVWTVLAAASVAVQAQGLVLGVTEGVTYRATDPEIAARFEGIAAELAKAAKQPVTVKVISGYNDMRAALKAQSVDIAYIHPAHVALEAVKAQRYKAVAWTNGFTEYKVSFLCRDEAPISDWKALATRKIVTPDPDSITAVMTRAILREKDARPAAVLNTRYQDAVPFYVENKFADFGATAARGVVKSWRDKGGKVCAESRTVPIKQWLVSTRLDAAATAPLRDALLGLAQNDAGKKALAASTYSGLVSTNAETEALLIGWLGL